MFAIGTFLCACSVPPPPTHTRNGIGSPPDGTSHVTVFLPLTAADPSDTDIASGQTPGENDLSGGFEALQTTQVPDAATTGALESFLADHGLKLASDSDPGVFVRWHYSGALRALWGDGLAIPLDSVGGPLASVTDAVQSFLALHNEFFGFLSINVSLENLGETTLKDGRRVHSLRQSWLGYPVLGTDVRVTVDPAGQTILSVFGTPIRDMHVDPGAMSVAMSVLLDDVKTVQDAALEAVNVGGGALVAAAVPLMAVCLDQSEEQLSGTPCYLQAVLDDKGRPATVVVEASSLQVLAIAGAEPSATAAHMETKTTFISCTNTSCTGDDDCDACAGDNFCFADSVTLAQRCFCGCVQPQDCTNAPGLGSNWGDCHREDGDYDRTCLATVPTTYRQLWDSQTGWTDHHYNHHAFLRAKTSFTGWVSFLEDDLGRLGWNNHEDCDSWLKLDRVVGGSGTAAGDGVIYWDTWLYLDGLDSDLETTSRRHHVMGHEGSHSVMESIASGAPADCGTDQALSPQFCLGENMADLGGSMYTKHVLGTATWEAGGAVLSGWMDATCGLDGPCSGGFSYTPHGHIPYAQRSRYDLLPCLDEEPVWLDQACALQSECPPYFACRQEPGSGLYKCATHPEAHNNHLVWLRFARVLAEGSGTFARDGHDETMGFSFSGIGDDTAFDLIYGAWLNLTASSDQFDFASSLLASAAQMSPSRSSETRYALGAIGYSGATFAFNGLPKSDEAPRAITFWAWQGSSTKTFFVYKTLNQSTVRVRYHNGSTWVEHVIGGSNTQNSPTAVSYGNRLYVFWRENGTNNIRLRYFNSDLSYGDSNLGTSLGLTADGAFDAAVFNGKLYMAFIRPNDSDRLSIAKCVEQSAPCTGVSSRWFDYSPAVFYKTFSYYSRSGIGLAAGSGVHGAGQGEYLYMSLAWPYSGANLNRLRVWRMDTTDSYAGYRWLSATHPANKAAADRPRAIEIREAAFPAAGKYAYLGWQADGETTIYSAVLQDWSYDGGAGHFTRPAGIGEATPYGVTFWRHDSTVSLRHVFAAASDQYCRYAVVWGRY